MHIVWALIVGLFVGLVAKALMPGKDPGGFIITSLLGIGGSLLASWLGGALGIYRPGDTGPGLIASIIGALLLLGLYRGLSRRTKAA